MSTAASAFNFEQARFNMIEQQIRPWEVLDARVLALLAEVKREQFVPAAFQSLALADMEIPLSHPVVEGECMLPPKVEARALQDLALQPGDNVLEIGTGSGYMAALLGKLSARVLSLEINPELARQAQARLAAAGIDNVEVRVADAAASRFAACVSAAPYDAIVVSGSIAEVPSDLLELLRQGGRLFAIVGNEPIMRATIVRRTGDVAFHTEQPWDIVAPRMRHFPEPSRFQF
ncbi:protein-L-isoaspartate O-methyltransferase family protein [Tepidicella xavieri]|uniref:Protein-L-isoaspartate O-methyltransferase n=1 Tax=Tepidicella xavieri TaxID=360241 RepID=A0A4R6U819_9BURK|nr:protein-L-isoaspartate O-methyltransferase [Tepidicella xavieri]TDQ41946.1 protein-L-isoaspartate(D-aspartate) O-methyltransferase [Tepidicella xavieri]